ncbi:hypothetical protein [Nitrospirillum sp. BR 11828]|uniref:hypothetical protein n=1 Tax=Nitrospirillum sp. BR 11828 TaxID=3104325 RepID=UPI002ACAB267|nr:hypothetical protein [Nitrospirillum sp. BR 11828]MDZ5649677.1 hypothetical protein [Nitrospirillum sp. BR 11828]
MAARCFLAVFLVTLLFAATPTSANEQTELTSARSRIIELIDRLQKIADSGHRLDVAYVEQTLNLHFTEVQARHIPLSKCEHWSDSAAMDLRELSARSGWFTASPDNEQDSVRDQASNGILADVNYRAETTINCTGWEAPLETLDTHVSFLPGVACLTTQDIHEHWRELEFAISAHGPIGVFIGPGKNGVRVLLRWDPPFHRKNDCASVIELRQMTRFDATYRKVANAHRECEEAALNDYAAVAPKQNLADHDNASSISLDDARSNREIGEYLIRKCGTFDAVYETSRAEFDRQPP